MSEKTENKKLQPYLSLAGSLALSIGSAIGWGSLVVTSSNYLGQAGPIGSILGLLIGACLMIIVSKNFHYLVNIFPDAGGIYAYTKNIFGYDRAFLVSWFLSLTYISMFWANATSLPLFARYFMQGMFKVGYLYTVFGYDVYFGEALLTVAAIAIITYICIKDKRVAAKVMVAMVSIFTIGISVCFIVAMLSHGNTSFNFKPDFIPDKNVFGQITRIAFISPWAYVGFENITHSSEEYTFKPSKIFKVLTASVVITTALYIFVIILSTTAYPADCTSWLDYISNLSRYDGIEGLPAFYAAHYYLGDTGVYILMISLLCLVLTSLIGHLRALSRLFYSVARDDILPKRFTLLNKKEIPENAMLLIAFISLPIPFLGRTAIGWIVDVTTIGATIIYGFTSAAAYKIAKGRKDKVEMATGGIGFVVMLLFGIYLLFPNLFSDMTLETETYILLIIWSIIGFFYFRSIISKDHARRFGKAIIVWITLLALVVFMSMIWSGRRDESITTNAIYNVQSYYEHTADPSILSLDSEAFIQQQIATVHQSNIINTVIVLGLFILALGAMIINHYSMKQWESKAVKERDDAREVAYKDPLTGVGSKHAYVEYERKMAEHIYNNDNVEFGVIVCDVNGLKNINDTLGHKAGDIYIQDACRLICDYFKHSPVFRVGGDEFAIILQGKDFDNRHEILKELNKVIEKNVGTTNVVASLGLAEFDPDTDNTFHAVFTKADARMYERKQELKKMGAITRD